MEITEVRIKLTENADDRLLGFCSITIDTAFVVRDIKLINGTNGPFVAMPSRKLTIRCPHCGIKNAVRANYCQDCGRSLPPDRDVPLSQGRRRLHADIAHPINSACREMIEARILAEYETERERSRQPGYVSRYDEDLDDDMILEKEIESHRGMEHHRQDGETSQPRPPHRSMSQERPHPSP